MSKLSRLRACTQAMAPDFASASYRIDWAGDRADKLHRNLDLETGEGVRAEPAPAVPIERQRAASAVDAIRDA
jgi:hypothetical protein